MLLDTPKAWRQGFDGGAVDCLLCGGEAETVRHFVMECRELQEKRRRYGVYGTEALEELQMFMEKSEEKVNRCKKTLEEMWRRIEQLWLLTSVTSVVFGVPAAVAINTSSSIVFLDEQLW